MRALAWIDSRMVALGTWFLGQVASLLKFLRFCADIFLALPSVFKNFHFSGGCFIRLSQFLFLYK